MYVIPIFMWDLQKQKRKEKNNNNNNNIRKERHAPCEK